MNLTSVISTAANGPDGGLGLLMSALAGIAAALAVAITLSVYFGLFRRSPRDVKRHALAAVAALSLLAYVAYDMRHAALDFLGINAAKPSVEFEIRLPQAALSAMSDTQVELHTDRNQKLAQVDGLADEADGRRVLKGVVTLDYRTTDRIMVVNLPGRERCEFKLRLAANPSRSDQFGPWHLADRLASAGDRTPIEPHDAFAIRYRVH